MLYRLSLRKWINGVYKIAELVINEYYDKLHDFSLNLSFYFDCKILEDSGIAVIV